MKNSKIKINTDWVTTEFLKLLENLTPDQWNIKVNKNWTIKDCVAHLVGWEKECVGELKKYWKTKNKPWFLKTDDFSKFNSKSINKYKNYQPKKIITEWKKWQKIFEEVIEIIGEDRIRKDKELSDWVFDEYNDNHYLEHLKQIKKALLIN